MHAESPSCVGDSIAANLARNLPRSPFPKAGPTCTDPPTNLASSPTLFAAHVDPDLAAIRDGLRVLREEYKGDSQKPGLFGISFKNPLKEAAESIGVEWKD